MEYIFAFMNVTIYIVAIKAIIGFHFPWERCKCCGMRIDQHPDN
jgi:hypothetical protein